MTNASGAAAPAPNPIYRRLLPGDRFPTLGQACGDRPVFEFNTLAGRYQLFGFFLSADDLLRDEDEEQRNHELSQPFARGEPDDGRGGSEQPGEHRGVGDG